MKEIESHLDRSNRQPVAPTIFPTTEPEISGPGKRLYHSVRADIFNKTAQTCLTKGDKVGYYRNMKEVIKHRELAGQLLLEGVEL